MIHLDAGIYHGYLDASAAYQSVRLIGSDDSGTVLVYGIPIVVSRQEALKDLVGLRRFHTRVRVQRLDDALRSRSLGNLVDDALDAEGVERKSPDLHKLMRVSQLIGQTPPLFRGC